jgi:uncharacterized cupredoxin-like copper-binding protein
MIKKILFLILTISVAGFAQLMSPKIIVQPTEHDFGKINQGDKVTHVFVITNSGGDLLIIEKVQASCGCTAANPEKNELTPGESTNLSVTFNSQGRHGAQKKNITIKSNDPENPLIKLTITATVIKSDKLEAKVPVLYFKETKHDFGKVKEGNIVEYTFSFLNTGKEILKIKDVRTSCGCTAALVSSEKLEPGSEGTLKVELDTKNRSGKMSRTITIQSNDPRDPTKILTVYAEVEKES